MNKPPHPQDPSLIDIYTKCSPSSLIADCNRMIEFLSFSRFTYRKPPDKAAEQLAPIYRSEFARDRAVLCMAGVSHGVDMGPLKEFLGFLHLGGCPMNRSVQETEAEINRLWFPCLEALEDLKLALMVKMAEPRSREKATDIKVPECPPPVAWQAWNLRGHYSTQKELAKVLLGSSKKQGQLSKLLKKVQKYLEAGGVAPALTTDKGSGPLNLKVVDPSKIDMGRPTDGRSPAQRQKSKEIRHDG